jgi:hypothetical protein
MTFLRRKKRKFVGNTSGLLYDSILLSYILSWRSVMWINVLLYFILQKTSYHIYLCIWYLFIFRLIYIESEHEFAPLLFIFFSTFWIVSNFYICLAIFSICFPY